MRYCILGACLLLVNCSQQIRQFYPDSFYSEDRIYQNSTLKFSLNFRDNWSLVTNPNNMDRAVKRLARGFQKQGIELLFVGSTVDALQGVQGVAANLNLPVLEYAQMYRDMNKETVSNDSGLVNILVEGTPMIRWNYNKFGYRFVEYFFTIDTYNMRIAFWATPPIFDRFSSVYVSIISSLEVMDQY